MKDGIDGTVTVPSEVLATEGPLAGKRYSRIHGDNGIDYRGPEMDCEAGQRVHIGQPLDTAVALEVTLI